MKEIINGKVYNTETSKLLIGCYSGSGFNFFEEKLYITKKGKYFIHGTGGPMTEYSISSGNSVNGSSKIELVDKEGVLLWIEKRSDYFNSDDIDITMNEFGIEEG